MCASAIDVIFTNDNYVSVTATLNDNRLEQPMRTQKLAARISLCAAMMALLGCQGGGSSRSNFGPAPSAVPAPSAPDITTPQFGPPAPLNGPSLEGPAFPPSTDGGSNGFDRKRHTQRFQAEESPNYAGTAPPPIRLDGPVAGNRTPAADNRPRLGYIELPPAP